MIVIQYISDRITLYRNSAFEIANLTSIHDKLMFEAKRALQREIVVNAKCVHSDRCSGAHDQLWLVL